MHIKPPTTFSVDTVAGCALGVKKTLLKIKLNILDN